MGDFGRRFKVKLGKGRDGQDALHKPLLLLLLLKSSCSHHSQRLIEFQEVDRVLQPLLERLAGSTATEYPFVRLGNDEPKLWEVPGVERAQTRVGKDDAKRSELIRLKLKGGFVEPVWQQLRTGPGAREEAIRVIVQQITEERREEVLAAVLAAEAIH